MKSKTLNEKTAKVVAKMDKNSKSRGKCSVMYVSLSAKSTKRTLSL